MPTSPHIVIIGGGFGGAYCAQELERRIRRDEASTLLIDRHNYFIFYPLLVEAGTGALEPRHAVISLRSFLKNTRFRMAEVVGVDTGHRTVFYRTDAESAPHAVGYDELVVSLGSVTYLPREDEVPGLAEHGLQIKSLADAVSLRDRAVRMLELADACERAEVRRSLLHFVVVGANFTGAEVAGEFHEFLHNAAKHYPNIRRGEPQLTLVERDSRILRALDEDLADYATRQLRRRGIDVRLENTLRSVARDHVILRDGQRLDARTVIWCAGVEPHPLVAKLNLPTNERGYILCDRDLRVKGYDNVWAIGDCALNPGPDGKPYPPTAQHAVRQGRDAARNIVRHLRGERPQPHNFRAKGTLAALGCRTGVARVMGLRISGFAAWWLWRSVYLMKMPGWGRRIRVALDWSADLLSRRDYVELGLHRPRPDGETSWRG